MSTNPDVPTRLCAVPAMAVTRDPIRHTAVSPLDESNERLLENVRPIPWTNPSPAPIYNLLVVGAGSGGLVSAAVAAGLGGKVAIVERNLMGGDCLNFGCVPSKALLHRARALATARRVAGEAVFDEASLDREFSGAMQHVRDSRAVISHDDSARRYRDELGVDVFLGSACFTGPDTVEVGGEVLRFRKAVIATGARAAIPDVPGLAASGYLTNETVFNLTTRPRRLAILGAGPIGCEIAQAMGRFGCEVTIFERAERILSREDPEAAAVLAEVLQREGIRLVTGAEVDSVERRDGGKTIRFTAAGESGGIFVDEILVGVGRRPNVENLGLEEAGVAFDARGVQVDDTMRTTNRRVYGVGDCCMRWQFTHAADAAAKIVVQNALFLGRKKLSALTMPWCTYTEPEIAHVGDYEADARARGVEVDTFTVPLERVNRAVCDEETLGFVKVHTRKGTDRILGATIVASHAGEMISELTLAIANGLGLSKLSAVIHPYPTQAEGIKAAANAYIRTRLTPRAKTILAGWLRFVRRGTTGARGE